MVLGIVMLTLHLHAQNSSSSNGVVKGIIKVKKSDVNAFLLIDCKYKLTKKYKTKKSWFKLTTEVIGRTNVDEEKFALKEPQLQENASSIIASGLKYSWVDTPRTDTVTVLLVISKRGVCRFKQMNYKSVGINQKLVYALINKINTDKGLWRPGGYNIVSGWFKKSSFVPRRFYCEARIIISSFPLTNEQWQASRR